MQLQVRVVRPRQTRLLCRGQVIDAYNIVEKNSQDALVSLVLAVLRLANLLDLVESFEQLIAFVIVQRVGGPGNLTSRLVVQTSMNCAVLAFADAVVVLHELPVRT